MSDCNCQPDIDGNFTRVCDPCGRRWKSLYCPHNRLQNPCPTCGYVSTTDLVLAGYKKVKHRDR
jgi:hypothetical protein